jgi:nucleoside-diphosphate-sugar epimerase
MASALIGYSGFVGSTLLRQASFDSLYRSSNIDEIAGHSFDVVVCAAARAQKWVANRDPDSDRAHIDGLCKRLETITASKFILISTVDVFREPVAVDEESIVDETGLHAYGLHRRWLERFVESHFDDHLVVRLPGLVGPGLRKNVIYDLLNANDLHAVDSRSVFQFYPMVNLWWDIQTVAAAGLATVHLTSEPISVGEVAGKGFGTAFEQRLDGIPARYDMRTINSDLFGVNGHYQYTKRETIQAVRAYVQSEVPSVRASGRAGT